MTDNVQVRSNDDLSKGELGFKVDPDISGSPARAFQDEGVYEDAGDLDFTNSAQTVYLTRIPKFLWKTWSIMDDDHEVEIGTVRVEGDFQQPKRVSVNEFQVNVYVYMSSR